MSEPLTITETLLHGHAEAVMAGINPRCALLGPVKYAAWRNWVKTEVKGYEVPVPVGEHETFYGMIIVPVGFPGITICDSVVEGYKK